jgi:hypothetical protein
MSACSLLSGSKLTSFSVGFSRNQTTRWSGPTREAADGRDDQMSIRAVSPCPGPPWAGHQGDTGFVAWEYTILHHLG